jgi:hypothetical protein
MTRFRGIEPAAESLREMNNGAGGKSSIKASSIGSGAMQFFYCQQYMPCNYE